MHPGEAMRQAGEEGGGLLGLLTTRKTHTLFRSRGNAKNTAFKSPYENIQRHRGTSRLGGSSRESSHFKILVHTKHQKSRQESSDTSQLFYHLLKIINAYDTFGPKHINSGRVRFPPLVSRPPPQPRPPFAHGSAERQFTISLRWPLTRHSLAPTPPPSRRRRVPRTLGHWP